MLWPVVFAEGGTGYFWANLNGTRASMALYCETVPAVKDGAPVITPCTDPSYKGNGQLKQLSCAAQKGGITTVVNMCDLQPCTPGSGAGTAQGVCPSDGMYLYDTTVVFSETGQVRRRVNAVVVGCRVGPVRLTARRLCVRASAAFGEVLEVQPVLGRLPVQPVERPCTHHLQVFLWRPLRLLYLL